MNISEILLVIFIVLLLMPRQPRSARARIDERRIYAHLQAVAPPGLRPVTPEPSYICENCGMLVHTGHGHTREECESYNKERPFKPDHRCTSAIYLDGYKGRNDPKIMVPFYYEAGTFQNWGAGK